MAENEEELKSLLMRVEEESEKVSLKLNTQNTKIMASSPITSWQIDGEKVETVGKASQVFHQRLDFFQFNLAHFDWPTCVKSE